MPLGFAAIGAAVAGGFGAASISTIAAISIGVISSAVIGAAIGGITAAITGGDIGKGMLFGAVGGVITGGIAGGGIVSGLGVESASITSGSLAGQVGTGVVGAYDMVGTVGAYATKPVEAAGGGLFGGALNMGGEGSGGIMGQVVTKGIDLIAAGFGDDPHVDWRSTKEGVMYGEEAATKRQQMALSARGGGGGGGSGHAPLPWQSTEEGAKYTLAEQYRQAELKESGAMGRLTKQYALESTEAQRQYEEATAKYGESAALAGGQKFEGASEEARAAIRERQGSGAPPVQEEVT